MGGWGDISFSLKNISSCYLVAEYSKICRVKLIVKLNREISLYMVYFTDQGPVVQSIVSLTSSLSVL